MGVKAGLAVGCASRRSKASETEAGEGLPDYSRTVKTGVEADLIIVMSWSRTAGAGRRL